MGAQYNGQVLADGALAYWKLEETGTITTVRDVAGNFYNGTAAGTVVSTSPTIGAIISDLSYAMVFDGTTSSISTTLKAPLNNVTAFSVECFLSFATAVASSARVISTGNAGTTHNGFEFFVNTSTSVATFIVGNGTSAFTLSTPALSLLANTYYHFVCTWTGGNQFIYLNGVQKATQAAAVGTGLGPPDFNVMIGNSPAANNFYKGNIDEVAVYTGTNALSVSQALVHYNNSQSKNTVTYSLPYNNLKRVFIATDLDQMKFALQHASGAQEIGHYFLEGPSYVAGGTVAQDMLSLARGNVPVSVVVDAAESANSGYATSPPTTAWLTASGFQVWDTTSAINNNPTIGGNYTISW